MIDKYCIFCLFLWKVEITKIFITNFYPSSITMRKDTLTIYTRQIQTRINLLTDRERAIEEYSKNFSDEIVTDPLFGLLFVENMDALIKQEQVTNNVIFSILNKGLTDYEQAILSKIKEYIWTHIKEKNDCLSIARYVGMSRSAFFRFFKKHYQCSVIDYMNEQKMKNAAEMLKTSNEKLASIAYEYGFESSNRFSKLFKRYMGMTPSEFRGKSKQFELNFNNDWL